VAALVNLSFLTDAELTALRLQAATELSDGGGRHRVQASSGDVSVAHQFGVTLDVLLNSIAYELEKRGTSTPRISRTRVQFS
jgi:hypothetical protein